MPSTTPLLTPPGKKPAELKQIPVCRALPPHPQAMLVKLGLAAIVGMLAFVLGCSTQPTALPPAGAPKAITTVAQSGPDPADLTRAQEAARAEIRVCSGPTDPTGDAAARVTFATSGRAGNAAITGLTLEGTEAGTCALRALRELRVRPFAGAPHTITFDVTVDKPPPLPPRSPSPPPSDRPPERRRPEEIQAVVRARFDVYRACYVDGLHRDPDLRGIVNVRFVITQDGSVFQASSKASTMPDTGVRACVTNAFTALRFPPGDPGLTTITYPIMFSPEG